MSETAPGSGLRHEYTRNDRVELVALDDPIHLFARWFQEVVSCGAREPNAMTLATVDQAGRPAARVVLLKGFDHRGFTFFTNYESRKGLELAANPHACLVFFWAELERQVRIEGAVERVSAAESDAYFQTRPRLTQIGTWASDQSRVITGREVVMDRMLEATMRFEGKPVPRPSHWGGYRVIPVAIEFWLGRRSRLHDRLRYARAGDNWQREVLAP